MCSSITECNFLVAEAVPELQYFPTCDIYHTTVDVLRHTSFNKSVSVVDLIFYDYLFLITYGIHSLICVVL